MRNRQIRLIIGVLVALVLFASSLALLFYLRGIDKEQKVQTQALYVASKDIQKGQMISLSDLQKADVSAHLAPSEVLDDASIIGKYAAVDIFKHEVIRKEKLTLKQIKEMPKVESGDEEVKEPQMQEKLTSKKDTITLALSLFQNIDTTLQQGDTIDIVSVIPKESQRGRSSDYETKYIALDVTIDTFVSGASRVGTIVQGAGEKMAFADSVIFEMSPKEIKNFFSIYYKTQELNANRVFNTSQTNKGHLWMVKRAQSQSDTRENLKNRLMLDHVPPRRVSVKKESVSISYEK